MIALTAFAAGACGALAIAQLLPARPPLLAALARRVRPGAATASLDRKVAAAGSPAGFGPREVMAAKLAGGLAGALFGALLSAAAPGRLGVLLVLAAPAAGFLAPDFHLTRLAAARARRVRRELPALLDLLRVQLEAGAALPQALQAVGERASGPLAGEWRRLGREVELGSTLAAGLNRLEQRVPLPEVRSLVAALERARRHGSPPAEALKAQAQDARASLARSVREEAARAGPKIQLVVALLLVPSVLLLVAAALVSALLASGGGLLPV